MSGKMSVSPSTSSPEKLVFLHRTLLNWKLSKIQLVPHCIDTLKELCQNHVVVFVSDHLTGLEKAIILNALQKTGINHDSSLQTEWKFIQLGRRPFGKRTDNEDFNALVNPENPLIKSIVLVPLIFEWHRNSPSPLISGTWGLLRYSGQIVISVGKPFDLSEFLKNNGHLDSPLNRLRRTLIKRIWRERRVILGDRHSTPEEVRREVFSDPDLQDRINSLASESSLTAVQKRVRKLTDEIAERYTNRGPQGWKFVLAPLVKRNLRELEFDETGLARLRQCLRDRQRIVLVPCHRSHLDYMTLSYGFYLQGMIAPLVAAGQNLAFFPMGWVFRRTGAFFIRRSFKGLDLYPHVFVAYLKTLLKKYHPIEFFLEGTRSRTGKLLPPRLGMLNMIIDAIHSGNAPDIAIIPIAVTYDRIMEDDSYVAELSGEKKEKEHLTTMIRGRHVLKKKLGRIYVSIADILPIQEFLSTGTDLSEVKDRLGHEIMNRIRTAMPITPVSLVALVIASARSEDVSYDRLMSWTKTIYEYFKSRRSILARQIQDDTRFEDAIVDALHFLTEIGYIAKVPGPSDRFQINSGQYLKLVYSKNSIMGLLVPACCAALSLSRSQDSADGRWLLDLMTPALFPLTPESIDHEYAQAMIYLRKASESDLDVFTSVIEPEIKALRIGWEAICRVETDACESVNVRKLLENTLREDDQLAAFPEILTAESLKSLYRIFSKNGAYSKNKNGGLRITSSQHAAWDRIQYLDHRS